jgi:hypothetical protein
MSASSDLRRRLEEIDLPGLRRAWKAISPHLPQVDSDEEALIACHAARTAASSISFRARAYSHRWLLDRGFPSQLPDNLKPRAERIYPRVVEGVLISVNYSSNFLRPVAKMIERAMSNAAAECYADKKTDPDFVRARMGEARKKEEYAVFGRMGPILNPGTRI